MTIEVIGTGRGSNPELLRILSSGLTVRMIMTRRNALMTCAPDDPIPAVMERNKADRFSFIPVMDQDHFVGLLRAENWFTGQTPDAQVKDHLAPLSEVNLIGGNASILDFVMAADTRPCRLVVSGERIEGLVSLSDLQQLPVRSALFAMITGLELVMADLIRNKLTEDRWLPLLSEERAQKVKDEISRSKQAEGYVDALLFTQFADKAAVVRKAFAEDLDVSRRQLESDLSRIQKLRNNLAHANEYAATPADGVDVSRVTRRTFELLELFERVGRQSSGDAPAFAVA